MMLSCYGTWNCKYEKCNEPKYFCVIKKMAEDSKNAKFYCMHQNKRLLKFYVECFD